MTTSFHTAFLRACRRLLFRWRRTELDRELAEEMEFHRALKQQAAGELSYIQMGNMTLAAEECRDMWSFLKLETLLKDPLRRAYVPPHARLYRHRGALRDKVCASRFTASPPE